MRYRNVQAPASLWPETIIEIIDSSHVKADQHIDCLTNFSTSLDTDQIPPGMANLSWDRGASHVTINVNLSTIVRRHRYCLRPHRSGMGARAGCGRSCMFTINRHPVTGYLVATAGVLLVALSPWWFTPLIGDKPPVRLMLIVVVGVSTWLGGLGPGLLATTLGFVAIVATSDFAVGNWPVLSTKLVRFGSLAILISLLFRGVTPPGTGPRIKEQAFRRSEGRYRRLIETAGQGIWLVDLNGRTRYANPRLGEILGIPPSQIVGSPLSWVSWKKTTVVGRVPRRNPIPSRGREVRLRRANDGGSACHHHVATRWARRRYRRRLAS